MRTDLFVDPLPHLAETLELVDGLDAALVDGLARPNPAHATGLAALAAALDESPLRAATAEAVDHATAGTLTESDLTVLAAARSALLGAVHDALAARVDEATGRARLDPPRAGAAEEAHPNLLAGARSWLAGIARVGWSGLDHALVAESEPLVAALLAEPELRRLAVLLDGFAGELDALCPGSTAEAFPARRWADLWARATLLAQPAYVRATETAPVTGRLLPLGVDLAEHPTAVQARLHAVLEPADGSTPRLVRVTVTAPKPRTIVDAGCWRLLSPSCSALEAAAQGRSIQVDGMDLQPSGDLSWDDALASPGEAADPFATARVLLQTASGASPDPLDRHPVALAEPVFCEGYQAVGDQEDLHFEFPGYRLRVDAGRLPAASPLTPATVAASTACIGLLRWDAGEFVLQPLAVEHLVKKKAVTTHAGAWAAGTTDKVGAKGDKAAEAALTTLRERAGKLLRS